MQTPMNDSKRAIYRFIFDSFAVTTKEIAANYGMSTADAYAICRKLEDANLITGEATDNQGSFSGRGKQANNFNSLLWQCWKTYDYISAEEAMALYDEKMK